MFKKEVQSHVLDVWIDVGKRNVQYQPPRSLEEIDADLDAVSAEIMELLQEVHS